MKLAIAALTLAFAGDAFADRVIQRERGDSVNENVEDLVGIHPHNDMIIPLVAPLPRITQAPASHTLFMNRCPGGCLVSPGNDDSRAQTSSIIDQQGMISAFPYGDTAWQNVMSCIKGVFQPFNVQVTDVNPGQTASYMEVLVGGNPQALGFDPRSGGVAPFSCEPYVDNAVVFDFAGIWGSGSTCGTQCVVNICATAAQEIAHTWALDHVIDPGDALTYYGQDIPTPRTYRNVLDQCGSDCVGGKGPLPGETCSGTGKQNHACYCTGNQTQNSYQTVASLFGLANATKPTVAITAPQNGATVGPMFDVTATCTVSDSTVQQVDIYVDGALGRSLVSAPYSFSATLAAGTHKLTATCTTAAQAQASADITVNVGTAGCTDAASCPNQGDVCVSGACVAGATTPGGFGATCTNNDDCSSSLCASDGTSSYCVITCTLGADNACPAGYTCTNAGTMGVCFPGGGDGGGCSTSGDAAPAFLGLGGFVALVLRRRRSRK